MTLLAIDWASTGVKAAQFVLSFSILVILHELGHFIPARLFKCRVEKFYLFFNPWFSLWKKKVGETEYGIGWIPFGGFVKISGMIDESMDKEQMKQPAQPWEFRAKPAWQRLIIMTGGVIVNVILAIVIFICITWVWGVETLPAKNLKYGVYADSLAQTIGIRNGDNIVALDGKPVDNIVTLESDIVFRDVKKLQVQRDGQTIDVVVPDDFASKIKKTKFAPIVYPAYPAVVDSIHPTAHFISGELKKGDRFIALNNRYFSSYAEFAKMIPKYRDSTVDIKVLRGSDTAAVRFVLNGKNNGFASEENFIQIVHKQYSLGESIPAGFTRCWDMLGKYVTSLKRLFSGKDKTSESLGSVISIGNTFPGIWDWERFWTLTGIFSIILAFMNILPIPALDGGHALFTLIEMITGRKPSDKFMEYAQMFGMILLFGLMAYALGLDFWRLFKK